jgi:hypothetical protein
VKPQQEHLFIQAAKTELIIYPMDYWTGEGGVVAPGPSAAEERGVTISRWTSPVTYA